MELLAPILAVAGLAFLVAMVRRGGFVGIAACTLVAGSCFGYYFQHLQLGPLPLSTERFLVVCMGLAYAVCRWKQVGLEPKDFRKADLLVLTLIAVLAFSTFLHDWKADRFQPVSRLVLLWLMPATFYWIIRQSRLGQRPLQVAHMILAVFGVYLSITAWAETQSLTSLVFPRYIMSPQFGEFLGRGRGPFLNPVGNGLFMVAGMAATILAWPRVAVRGKFFVVLAMFVYAVGIYSTYTRSIWASALVVGMMTVGYLVPRPARIPALAGILLVIAAGLASQWNSLLAFKRDRNLDAATTLDSIKLRPILGYVAWQMFQDHPLLGCGYGQYTEQVKSYTYDRNSPLQVNRARHYVPHNIFFALATETGLAGLVTFVLMLGYWLWDCWRLLRTNVVPSIVRSQALLTSMILIAFVINGLAHEVTLISMCNMLLFFMSALSTGLAAFYLRRPSVPVARTRVPAISDSSQQVLPSPATVRGI